MQVERSLPGGSCNSFTALRDPASFYRSCLPYIRSLPCSSLTGFTGLTASQMEAQFDPSCRSQFQLGSVGRQPEPIPPPGPSQTIDAGGSRPTTSEICTEGTSTSCVGYPFRWTGSQCCVSNVAICTEGTVRDCHGDVLHWTGRRCCVEGPIDCTRGTSEFICCGNNGCSETRQRWTGTMCCTKGG